jgi:hypothetical protein
MWISLALNRVYDLRHKRVTRIGTGLTGELINVQPGLARGSRVNLLSVTFNFVF